MWEASVKAMQPRNIGLISTEVMAPKYMKSGFPIHAFDILSLCYIRHKEPAKGFHQDDPDLVLQTVDDSLQADVFQYQNSVVAMPECEFKNVFLKVSSQVTAAVNDGTVVGYGAIQKSGDDWRIAPLHSESKSAAKFLLHSLLSIVQKGSKVILHVLGSNRDFIHKVAKGNGLTLQSEITFKRLQSKRNVDLDIHKIFAVWNLDSIFPPNC